MMFSKIFILCITPILLFSCNGREKPLTSAQSHTISKPVYPFVTDFDKFVIETMAITKIPGAAVAIVKDSDILLLKGYGVKKFGSKDSVDIHSVFRIASVSKGFASMLTGILVQEKRLNWDDKVVKYLPYFKLKNQSSTNQLTIRHILSHTSGLPSHTFTNKIEQGVPYTTLRDKLCTVKITSSPGQTYAYQNVMYSLISDIVKTATKKTYATLLREKIFKPLRMRDASASYNEIMAAQNIALPHLCTRTKLYRQIKNSPQYYSVLPAAGINASISDMAQWLIALLGERPQIISTKTLSEIYKPEIMTPKNSKYSFFRWPHLQSASYGLGWRILNYDSDTLIYHGGHVNGYRSEIAFSPSNHIGIIILTNTTGKLANNGVEYFFDAFIAYRKSIERFTYGLKNIPNEVKVF